MPIPENNVRFTDLSNGTVKAGSIFATSEPDSSTPPSYDSTKVTAQAVGNFVATSQTYSGLQTIAKTLVGAINEAAQGGGGGSSTLAGLSDVQFTDLRDGQFAVYYANSQKWLNTNFDAAESYWSYEEESGEETVEVVELTPSMIQTMFDYYTGSPKWLMLCREINNVWVYYAYLGSDSSTATFARLVRESGRDYIEYAILTPWAQDVSEITIEKVPLGNIEVSGTLTVGSTSITLSDAAITTSSTIDIYTDTYGVNPTAVTVSTGSVTMTFESQANNVSVKVRVS